MLLPASTQQEGQSAHGSLPEGIRVKHLPNFAAEFLSDVSPSASPANKPRSIKLCSLVVPSEMPFTAAAGGVESCHHVDSTHGCRITESGLRAEKLRRFAQDCSWALDHVYFGGDGVAQNKRILEKHGITHVVNCVRLEVQNCFDGELQYFELYLQDSGGEDILAVLYDVFDFIEEAKERQGRVFVHCSQGVSRSAALVIAYVMWRTKQSFETTRDQLKLRRGVVDPNFTFCTQLMSCNKRFRPSSEGFLRIYRLASQSMHVPTYLVPKLLDPQYRCVSARGRAQIRFDPRGTFVIHGPGKAFIWVGSKHAEPYLDSARKFARQLTKYEHAPPAVEVHQDCEPPEFFHLIAEQSHGKTPIIEEHECFTSDYNRFSHQHQVFRLSSSMKESGRQLTEHPVLRRVVSEMQREEESILRSRKS